ncbi:MAG TPA: nucleotidyltransferase [Verrucomicrobia bacterium]|nr:MAG: hypothetical protein A2X46_14005 [Lentisphaerae bacterium GWF2_57_35]HBA84798.1 nucleotidyltransferase [Verrucomicrobiota bacterium]
MKNLGDLLKRLTEHKVQYVLVGGYAAAAHGATLVTQDVDICFRFSVANLMRLQKALADLHPVHRLTPQRLPLLLTPKACKGLKNLYISTDGGILDCLGNIAGIGDYASVRQQSESIDLGFGPIRMLTLDSLIKAKEAMNRPRDREAVIQLKAVRERKGG